MERNPQPLHHANLSARSILFLYLLALAPRLALALPFLGAPISVDDMYQYDMLARSVASGDGYRWYARADVEFLQPYLKAYYGFTLPLADVPVEGYRTVFRAPGYPFFLAAVYAMSNLAQPQDWTPAAMSVPGSLTDPAPAPRFAAARLAQAALGALLAPLAALLAVRLALSRRAALLAGGAAALYPILLFYPLALASENLFIVLMLGTTILLLKAIDEQHPWTSAAAGLLLGLATLTRSMVILVLPLGAAALWARTRSPAQDHSLGRRDALIFTLGACLVVVPWAARNSLVVGRPAFVENSLGYNLFVSYHPQGNGGFAFNVAGIPLRILDDGARDRWSMQQAIEFMRADPVRAALLAPRRLLYFWGLEDREMLFFYTNGKLGAIPQPWLGLAYLLLILPLMLAGLAAPFGIILTPAHRRLMLGLLALGMLPYLLILAEPRFHLPLTPYLIVYAAAAWTWPGLAGRIRKGWRGHETAWIAASAVGVLLIAIWAAHLWREWPQVAAAMGPGGSRLYYAWGF
jgi:4-amino-4-deoxy-L-arabinose transferase-like glycosyltransferase